MRINRVMVIGAGTMGAGIAQVCAQARCEVSLNDADPSVLEKALKTIRWSVGKLAQKGILSENPDSITNRIRIESDLSAAAESELVVEAVFEDLSVKQELFKKISSYAERGTLIASNTSAIPITELAAVTRSPEDVLGLHFFNPVPMMKAVEVVRGMQTSPEVVEKGGRVCQEVGHGTRQSGKRRSRIPFEPDKPCRIRGGDKACGIGRRDCG